MYNDRDEFTIRTMTKPEVTITIDWAANEGWNPGLYDADCFYQADPNGFLIGLLGSKPIATISAVKYGTSFGFLGFYIVKPEHRDQGYGIKIWNAGLKYLAGRNIGLDGIVAQQENYKKSGFKLAYKNIRYQGKGGGNIPNDQNIIPLSDVPIDAVINYDKAFFPDDRSTFLKAWINQKNSISFGANNNGKLAGYGMFRVCRSGFKIGPLFADRPAIAKSLFLALKSSAPEDAPIYFDTPELNRAAIELAEENGMNVVFETARMYTSDFPQLPLEKIFGVTTFELG